MEKNVKERRFFPGANSAYGFFSFFDQIALPQTKKVFIIKGGPGVGKSTFMKKIGAEMQKYGFEVEYHHCASDSESLDALVILQPGIVFMDGTAPHVVDPKYPGAVEEIINLGSYWDSRSLGEKKDLIISLNAEIGRLFKHVYRFLSVAKVYLEGLESYAASEEQHDKRWMLLTQELIEEILGGKSAGQRAGVRKLFASAISPQGTVNFLDGIVAGADKIYILSGPNGKRKKEIMKKVADAAYLRGFYIEVYPCALDPFKIDHLVIPELKVALINSLEPHLFSCPAVWQTIDTESFDRKLTRHLQEERDIFHLYYQKSMTEALSFLRKAKAIHDELEECYIPYMDFGGIDLLRQEIMKKILAR